MKIISRHVIGLCVMRIMQIHCALIILAMLPQVASMATGGSPALIISPVESIISAICLVLPLTIPIACLAGTAMVMQQFSRELTEVSVAASQGSVINLRALMLVPVCMLSVGTLALQYSVVAKANYFIRGGGLQGDVSKIVDIIDKKVLTPEYGKKQPVYLTGTKLTEDSLTEVAFAKPVFSYAPHDIEKIYPVSKYLVTMAAKSCKISRLPNGSLALELRDGSVGAPQLPLLDSTLAFAKCVISINASGVGLKSSGHFVPSSRTFAQILNDKNRASSLAETQTIAFEPYFRLLLGLLPIILCMQLLLSIPVALPREHSQIYSKGFFIILIISLISLVSTRSASHSSAALLITEIIVGLFAAPLIINRLSAGYKN